MYCFLQQLDIVQYFVSSSFNDCIQTCSCSLLICDLVRNWLCFLSDFDNKETVDLNEFFLLLWSNRYLIYFQRLSKMMEPVSYLKYMVHCVVWLGLLKGVNVINSLADFHYLISYVFFSTQQYFTRHVVCEIKQHRTYITY